MDRDDLHGGGVAVEPAGALAGGDPRRSSRSHSSSAGQPEALAAAGLVQRLGDVAQVGQQPLAADRAEHPGGQPALLGRLEQGGHPAPAQQQRPAPQRSATSSVSSSPPASSSARVSPEERRERGGAHPAGPVRLLERLEQGQPLVAGRRGQQLGRRRRRPPGCRARRARAGPAPPARALADEDRDVARPRSVAVPGRVGGEQGGDVGGAVGGDVLAGVVGRGSVAAWPSRKPVARAPAGPGTAPACGAPTSRLPAWAAVDVAHDDPRVTERRAAQHHLEPLDQRRVAAPVGAEGRRVVAVAAAAR